MRRWPRGSIGDAAGNHRALRIHDRLLMILIDISPPRLRMTDEIYRRIPLEHFVEALEPHIVGLVLKVHEYRDIVRLRDLSDQSHRFRIAIHGKLLFTDADGAEF